VLESDHVQGTADDSVAENVESAAENVDSVMEEVESVVEDSAESDVEIDPVYEPEEVSETEIQLEPAEMKAENASADNGFAVNGNIDEVSTI
jgi:hypothetical protein